MEVTEYSYDSGNSEKKSVCLSSFLSYCHLETTGRENSGLLAEAKDFTILQSVPNGF